MPYASTRKKTLSGENRVPTRTSKVDLGVTDKMLLSIILGMKERGILDTRALTESDDSRTEQYALLSACIGLTILQTERNKADTCNRVCTHGVPSHGAA
jgi:hypothetical protein